MRKGMILIGLFAMIFAGSNVIAQEENDRKDHQERKAEWENLSPEEKAAKKTEHMTKDLDLTAEQSVKIEAINLAHILEMDKIKAERKALKEKAKAQKEKTKGEIDEVLTPEQREKLEAKKEERQKKREEKKKNCQHQ